VSTLEHALEYCRRGWNPTPVKPRAKAPIGDEWQHRVITAETAPQFFSGADLNVGLVLGPSSKGLTDVDLDCAEALAIAPYVLSPTSARFGRPSKRESHWLYTTDLAATADKASLQFRDGKKMLVELRTGSDTLGAQTVAPGSTHESGEAISWSENGTPAVVDGDNLRQRVSALAAYALIARHWPVEGEGRHEAALSLGGFLARAGRKPEAIKVIAEAIAKAANDPHWKDRARAAQDSATATNQGKKAYGLPHLSELIGDSAKQAATWLGYSSKDADDNDDGDKKPKQADVLIALAADADLFHAPDGEAFADIPIDGHRETHRVRSQAFRQYLRHLYFKKARAGVNADAMQVAIETIAAKAVFEGEKHEVHIRVAELGDAIYIDIGNDSWRAIKVTAAGWQVVPSPPVRFQRSAGTRPLPTPQRGGSIQLLRPFCNVASKGDFVLLVAFALAVLRPNANYPVLVVTGEQGACKSTTIRFIVRLTDPRMPEQRSLPRDEDDLITAAKGSHLLPFDNVSGLVDWLSDAFCRLSTGGGAGKRRLQSV
jgi:Bifunctional DNA primase/polymerase, N-terminal